MADSIDTSSALAAGGMMPAGAAILQAAQQAQPAVDPNATPAPIDPNAAVPAPVVPSGGGIELAPVSQPVDPSHFTSDGFSQVNAPPSIDKFGNTVQGGKDSNPNNVLDLPNKDVPGTPLEGKGVDYFKTAMGALTKGQKNINQVLSDISATPATMDFAAAMRDPAVIKQQTDDTAKRLTDLETQIKQTDISGDRYMANKGTGAQIAAGIAVGLGALGSSISGGPNQASQIIQNAVNRDVDAQKANLDKLKSAADVDNNMLSKLMQEGMNITQAQQLSKAYMLDRAQAQIQATSAATANAGQQANLAQTYQALEQQKEQLLYQYTQLDVNHQRDMMKYKMDLNKQLVPGVGFATNEDTAKKLIEHKTATDNFTNGVNQLIALGEKGPQFWGTEEKALATRVANDLMFKYNKVADSNGVLRQGEMPILEKIIANPTDLFQVNNLTQLRATQADMQNNFLNNAKNSIIPGYTQPEFIEKYVKPLNAAQGRSNIPGLKPQK